MSMNNFWEVFAATAERHGARTAVEIQRREGLETFTYARLAALALDAAAALAARGVARGDRCAILADNDAYWCAAYLGILRSGAVAVPLDTHYSAKQIASLLRDCGARLLFCSASYQQLAAEAVRLAGTPCELLPLRESYAPATASALAACAAGREDPAIILYTSGTTSDPKGVVLTHGNLLAERDAVFAVIYVNEQDALLGVLPLFHALPQLANLLLPFAVGARVIFLETVSTTELLRALRERGATIFCCVPQFFYLIHQRVMQQVGQAGWARRAAFRALLRINGVLREQLHLNAGRFFFRRVHDVLGARMRMLVTGGSRFDPAVGRDLFRLGFNILQAYGLTECSGAATVNRPGDPHVEAVGIALEGVEVKIAPRDAGDGRGALPDGEVLIRGPINMQGYYGKPEANAETLRDGWLYTGDLGTIDSSGRLRITGRKKDVIILSNGKNIHPEEVEAHYLQSPYIKELCVMGLVRPGEPSAERLHAVVVPDLDVMRERKVVNMREILRFEIEGLGISLPSHKRVLSYEIWAEDLARTTTRKLKRFEIARLRAERAQLAVAAAAAETVSSAAASPTRAPLSEADRTWAAEPGVARALAIIATTGKVKTAVHPDANIELELGLDSLERVELLTSLEQEFGCSVPEDVRQKIYTVRELIEAVRPREGATAAEGKAGNPWSKLLGKGPGGVPEDDAVLCGVLEPKPVATAIMFALSRVVALKAWFLFGLRVTGTERLPGEGVFLLCPNHESFLDPFLLVGALPWKTFRRLFFVGAKEYFATPLTAWLARKANIVPVDPDANLVRAMQAGAYGLRHGKLLILFPEGERTVDGEIKKFKKGAAILAQHLRAPIVPVAIRGAFDFWPRGRGFQWSACLPGNGRRVTLEFGAPIAPAASLPAGVSLREAEAQYAAATQSVREAVVRMQQKLG
jgi:long-chain acyl-CoA synthetase